jgi:hypothetical protein
MGKRQKKPAAQSEFISFCAAVLPMLSSLSILYLRRTTSSPHVDACPGFLKFDVGKTIIPITDDMGQRTVIQ